MDLFIETHGATLWGLLGIIAGIAIVAVIVYKILLRIWPRD